MLAFLTFILLVLASPGWAEETDLSALVGVPVSVTAAGDRLLIADYRHLYALNGGRLDRLDAMVPEGVQFVPTDTAFDPETRDVFIANYTSNDILVGTLDLNKLTVTRRIGDGATVSPEGIALLGDRIAIANYDGNSVQVFERNASAGDVASCRVPLKMAHGIAYADGYLFASSLGGRKIVKIDPASCRIVAQIGSQGWKAGQFLWPTSISPAGPGRIVVADAHTGMLTVLGTGDLAVKAHWGGNGPARFNMPYGVEWRDGTIWVASAFNRSVVALGALSWHAAKRYSADKNAWAWRSKPFPDDAGIDGRDYDGYRARAPVTIRGHCYVPSYGALAGCTGKEPSLGFKFMRSSGYMYFTQALELEGGVLISSPQNRTALFYSHDDTSADEVEVGLDAWVVNGRLVGPRGPVIPKIPTRH
jgi:hypothetical protein